VFTNNVGLAAFLVVRGLKPISVKVGRRGFRTYEFVDDPGKLHAKEYWADAPVGVRTFERTRAQLKQLEMELEGAEVKEAERKRQEAEWLARQESRPEET
jgi:hypothetical protein